VLKASIYTPYNRCETALAAVQFADWLVRCGIEVSLLSSTPVGRGVHNHWDNQVRLNTKKNLYKWAFGATHICWFEPDVKAWDTSKLVFFENRKQTVKHLFFPGFSRLNANADYFLSFSDKTICLAQDIASWLNAFRSQTIQLNPRTWANLVSPGQLLLPKCGYIEKDKTRLMVFCLKEWEIDLPKHFFMLLEEALAFYKELEITVVFNKTIPVSCRKLLNAFSKLHGNRFLWKTRVAFYDLVGEARKHDLVYVTGTRYSYGSIFSLFASSSVPLICHDVPPVGAHVSDGLNGCLIPCELSKARVPIAEIKLKDIGEVLFDAVAQPQVKLKSMQAANTRVYEKKQQAFQRFIQKEFIE